MSRIPQQTSSTYRLVEMAGVRHLWYVALGSRRDWGDLIGATSKTADLVADRLSRFFTCLDT